MLKLLNIREYLRILKLAINIMIITFCVSRDDAKCIVITRVCVSVCVCVCVCVCLSVCPWPYAHNTARTHRLPPSCALLGGFASGARVSLLRQLRANAKCQRVLVCLVYDVAVVANERSRDSARELLNDKEQACNSIGSCHNSNTEVCLTCVAYN